MDYDASDMTWETADGRILGAVLYDARRLTRWEWIKVRLFRRHDPRGPEVFTFD